MMSRRISSAGPAWRAHLARLWLLALLVVPLVGGVFSRWQKKEGPDLDQQVLDQLKAAGSDLDRAVKTTVFLKSMDSFVAMNEVYGRPEYFGAAAPARSTVEVARLPRDVLVEIEVVALA